MNQKDTIGNFCSYCNKVMGQEDLVNHGQYNRTGVQNSGKLKPKFCVQCHKNMCFICGDIFHQGEVPEILKLEVPSGNTITKKVHKHCRQVLQKELAFIKKEKGERNENH
ncbi:MAG: hypothetical protein ACTSWD_11695 [Candidatus Heimdallarchaeota archaeon]